MDSKRHSSSSSKSTPQSHRQSPPHSPKSSTTHSSPSAPKNLKPLDLICIYAQLKSYHFMTRVYDRHLIIDKWLDEYSPLYDKFIESYYGRHPRRPSNITCNIMEITDKNIYSKVNTWTGQIRGMRRKIKDTGLISICDELLAHFDRLKYLIQLTPDSS